VREKRAAGHLKEDLGSRLGERQHASGEAPREHDDLLHEGNTSFAKAMTARSTAW
jgi:hypothetical protein